MPASDRIAKARQARNRRGGGGADEESTIEMSGIATLACIFLLLSMGASLATSYIMIHNPSCFGSTTGGGAAPATGSVRAAVTPAAAPVAPAPPSRPGFPPKCTVDQMKDIKKQLPPDLCYDEAYTQKCSFCRATNKGCLDSQWVREVYASAAIEKFNAVFINGGCERLNREVVDVMALGTHNPTKFDAPKWLGKADTDCKKPVTYGSPQAGFGLCIHMDGGKAGQVTEAKQALGLSDTDMKVVTAKVVTSGTTVDSVVEEAGLKDQPIHYLLSRGDDYDVLKGASNTLDQIRYMEFEYNWQGAWGHGQLSDIVKKQLVEKNLVCYWRGVDGNLWRITDCWQTHYAQQWWSQIACVSATHADAKPLFDKMEEIFLETLKKEQTFGG